MNVILLFSALFSALTGVGTSVSRAPVAAEQVTRAVRTAVAAVAPKARSAPVQAIDLVGARRRAAPLVTLPRFDIAPYASRRRE